MSKSLRVHEIACIMKKKIPGHNPKEKLCRKKNPGGNFFKCGRKSGEYKVTDAKLSKHFNEDRWSTMSNAAKLAK